jgi:hypothetical protein
VHPARIAFVCTGGAPLLLRAPFVNNQIAPSLFVQPALNVLKQKGWPTPVDQCGKVVFGRANNSDEQSIVGRID